MNPGPRVDDPAVAWDGLAIRMDDRAPALSALSSDQAGTHSKATVSAYESALAAMVPRRREFGGQLDQINIGIGELCSV